MGGEGHACGSKEMDHGQEFGHYLHCSDELFAN